MLLWLPFIVGIAIVLTVFQAHLREEQPAWGVLVAIAFATTTLLALLPYFNATFTALTALAQEASVSSVYLGPVLKTIGVAYLTSFGAQISKEAGEDTIASIVELGGKLVILIIALPLLQAILLALFGILGY